MKENKMEKTPFDELSLHTLTFLLERTDFSEPWLGFGFPTSVKEELEKALSKRKEVIDYAY